MARFDASPRFSATRFHSARFGRTPAGPVFTVQPVLTGTPNVGQTLSVSTGTATGSGTVTYARQWLRDGVAISGATGATYVAQMADDGTTVTVRVAATDDNGTTYATSNGLAISYAASPGLLLEIGGFLLLESGDRLLLE